MSGLFLRLGASAFIILIVCFVYATTQSPTGPAFETLVIAEPLSTIMKGLGLFIAGCFVLTLLSMVWEN